MPWVGREEAIATIERRRRYKVKLKPKGMDKFFTMDKKEIKSFIEWHGEMEFKMDGMKNDDRSVFIHDYREKEK